MKKLWEGRISGNKEKAVEEFNASIFFDCVLYNEDIDGSIAHAKMLNKIGVLSDEDTSLITNGLEKVREDFSLGKIDLRADLEDIHTHVESALRERIGEAAGRLHTARSRNDQVNTDVRLYIKKEGFRLKEEISLMLKSLYEMAEKYSDIVMPGYTHLQPAQPMVLSHLLLAYFFMLSRDYGRLSDALTRADMLTLGSGAFAGLNYNLDREMVRKALGFSKVSENAMDGVSSRDFIAEILSVISILFAHLSRISEDFIIFSSNEFRFVSLHDDYTTGSSIMPNKKNPDMLELTRGKTGRIYGSLISILTTMKGLPSAYNKDLQEDKESLFDAFNTANATIPIVRKTLETTTFNKEVMEKACENGFISAVEIADYLVAKGVPFREAHNAVGRIVRFADENGKTFSSMSIDEYRAFHEAIEEDVYKVVDIRSAIKRKVSEGSTGFDAIKVQIEKAKAFLGSIS